MKKTDFLRELRKKLSNLSYNDQKNFIDYYSEIIDDRIEDGQSEEEAIKSIGAPSTIANQILMDMPITSLAMARVKKERSGLKTALIIIGSPIWFSLLIAGFSIFISLFATLFSLLVVAIALIVVLWACEVSFAAGGVGGVIASVLCLISEGNVPLSLLYIGSSLILISLSIVGYYISIHGTKALIYLCGCFLKLYQPLFKLIRICLIGKER